MIPAPPPLSGAEAIRALRRVGFETRSQRGSHVKLRHPTSGRVAIVPLHDELAPGTLRSILRQAGLTADEILALL